MFAFLRLKTKSFAQTKKNLAGMFVASAAAFRNSVRQVTYRH